MARAATSPPAGSGVEVGLVGLAAAVEVPESASSQPPSLSVGLGERDDASLLPLRDVCLCCCCWLPEELWMIIILSL